MSPPVTYPSREVYAQPPVVLVACEVRFTDSPRLRQQETLDAVAIAVDRRFPLSAPLGGVSLVSAGPGAAPQLAQRQGVVLRNPESTEALTLTPASVSYETTDYRGFDAVREVMTGACRTLTDHDVRPAITRVGLRYIDEIRPADPPVDLRGWSTWVDPALLRPLSVGADRPATRGIQGAAVFDLDRGWLNFRYAAFTQGATTIPGHLRRRPFTPGPFFALDFDGFAEFGADPAVLLDPAVVADLLTHFHTATGTAFQRSITNDARALFRGNTPTPGP